MAPKHMTDPMERLIAEALDYAGIRYETDCGGAAPLDFHLVDIGLHIEVKRFHSPRIAEQMARVENVIAVQGERAVRELAAMITLMRQLPSPPIPG